MSHKTLNSKSLCFRWFLALILGVSLLDFSLGQDSEAQSFLVGMAENANSWRSFDCLVQVEYVDDLPDRHTKTFRSLERMICNYDSRMFCFVKSIESDKIEFPESKREKFGGFKVLVAEKERLHFRDGLVSHSSFPVDRLEGILSEQGFMDLRRLNMDDCFPLQFQKRGKNSYEDLLAAIKAWKVSGKVVDDINSVQVSYASQGNRTGTLVFAKESMQPTRWQYSLRLGDKINWAYDQDVVWKEINGAFVPVRVSASLPRVNRNAKIENRLYDATVSIRIHWFSLNEVLDKDLFREEICTDVQLAKSFVDPVSLNADSLLNEVEKISK